MAPSTRRGALAISMDPSDISSNKETMIDWLRIHFPMVSIPSSAKTEDVANIVRQQQPDLFPPQNNTHHTQDSKTIGDIEAKTPPVNLTSSLKSNASDNNIKSKRSGLLPTQSIYPSLPPDIKPYIKPDVLPILKLESKSVGPEKRAASSELSGRKKKVLHSSGSTGLSGSKSNKGVTSQKKRTKVDVKKSTETHEVAASHNLNEEAEKKEISALRISLATGPVPPADSAATLSAVGNISTGQGELIDFSVSDHFEVGNLVIGEDIPCIKPSGTKRSGVDVFLEARSQEKRISELEEIMADLKNKLEAAQRDSSLAMFENEKEKVKQEHINSIFYAALEEIEARLSQLELLETKVAHLEAKVRELEGLAPLVDSAQNDIIRHEALIDQLFQASDSEDHEVMSGDDEPQSADYF